MVLGSLKFCTHPNISSWLIEKPARVSFKCCYIDLPAIQIFQQLLEELLAYHCISIPNNFSHFITFSYVNDFPNGSHPLTICPLPSSFYGFLHLVCCQLHKSLQVRI